MKKALLILGLLASNAYSASIGEMDKLLNTLKTEGKKQKIAECGIEGILYTQRRFSQEVRGHNYDVTVMAHRDTKEGDFTSAALIDVDPRTQSVDFKVLYDGGMGHSMDGEVDMVINRGVDINDLKYWMALSNQGLHCELANSFKSYLSDPTSEDQEIFDDLVEMDSK